MWVQKGSTANKLIMAYLKILSWNFPGKTEENLKSSQSL